MKVTIDIPEEFVSHYNDDKFKDSLQRLKSDAHLVAGNYEKELADMLIKAFKDANKDDMPKLPTPPHPRWKPDEGEYYYMMMGSGTASEWIWHGDNDDGTCIRRYSIGNVFKTKEEVEFAAKRLKVLAEMQEWAGNYNDKYFLFYDVNEERIHYLPAFEKTVYGEMRFATQKDAENCIEAVGADRIIKYYFMIPEDEK